MPSVTGFGHAGTSPHRPTAARTSRSGGGQCGAPRSAPGRARLHWHAFIGTEHLLLGVLAEPDAVATRILAKVGAVERIRDDSMAVTDALHNPTARPPRFPMLTGSSRHELLSRPQRDQALRERASMQPDAGESPPTRTPALMSLGAWTGTTTWWLRTVIRDQGWQRRSMVGDDAAAAAGLLAQDADQDPEFQRSVRTCLNAQPSWVRQPPLARIPHEPARPDGRNDLSANAHSSRARRVRATVRAHRGSGSGGTSCAQALGWSHSLTTMSKCASPARPLTRSARAGKVSWSARCRSRRRSSAPVSRRYQQQT